MRALRLPGGSIIMNKKRAYELYQEFFGNPLGLKKHPRGKPFNRPLLLDVYETLYLAEKGRIEVYKEGIRMTLEELKSSYSYDDRVYRVYKVLRDKGLIVRNGTRFGAHFLVYVKGPDVEHAPYAVIVTGEATGLDVVRVSRLIHTVRKDPLLAVVEENRISFYKIRRFKRLKRY